MPVPTSRLSYITLGVTNLESMSLFYEAIGFDVWRQSNNPEHPYTMFSAGSIILALYPKHLLAKQSGCDIHGENTSMSLSLNLKRKNDVDEFLKLAERQGATITKATFTPAWGGYCGYFKDPQANLWEIVWHEHYTWTDDE